MNAPPVIRFLDRTTPPHISTLILLAGLSAMVMNIFLPSLPYMAEYFGTDYAVMQLSVPLFLFCSGILQLFIGPISDNLGRRKVMMGGLVLFIGATLGCIYAPNATVFLIFRIGQAIIATAMVLSRAVIRDLYSQDQSASMMGYVTMGVALVPMISPAIGGAIEQVFDWTVTFWLMAVLGGVILLIVWADMGETARHSGKTLIGQFREYPELLRARRFWGYAMASGFCSGAFYAYLGGAPFVGSTVFGLNPFWLGIYFGAPAIGYFAGNFLTGLYAVKFGINAMVLWGCIANALGGAVSLLIFLSGYGTAETFFGLMTLVGLGNGLCIPNAVAGMLSVRPHLAGTASGLGGAIMIGGGSGLAVLAGALLTPETGAYPLLWLMLLTAIAGVISIALVIRREKALGLALR
ncbi:multidrug effflux MFS transporter [Sulfitobacter mediterraneus]|uniref:multidrug effflux MFS transporter n=1 Tax=Sulfitobacter mediterraneus TaxID=83219 RepID=UPI0019316281|nr:multidrug effflux MFS transporter [Sulfitobacter mediterraneus]MBM1310880.1 multidrug effflux MFS transporter [Sulfitobacter mediterraneus]MBM1314764.1 multidrug effflux MFS transporter [Sulfitobacter mediterraneus]MBM1323124.1 multidrug effflux MFS transporter [Sulfitobacter mediterraneus]MBM1327036.1 multidrug effflux MFS transporter [Sulfitobacter mediterraneus]MBM1398382.1 multidrug effflux MFS transporter [Sulfitobacter mediterraneus]